MVSIALIGRENTNGAQKTSCSPIRKIRPHASAVPTMARPSSEGMVIAHCTRGLASTMRRRSPGSRAPHRPAMMAECTSECLSMTGTEVVRPSTVNSTVSPTAAVSPTTATLRQYAGERV
jgi:hypothetical protein